MSALKLKYLPMVARLVLGSIFFVFGLNGFLRFMPMPPMPDAAEGFLVALATTGYMFPLIKGVEVIGGLLLLTNRFVPLALALLAPGIVNIALFHAFLDPGGLVIAAVLLVLSVYLAWSYRDLYRPMLSDRVITTDSKRPEERYHFDHTAQVHS